MCIIANIYGNLLGASSCDEHFYMLHLRSLLQLPNEADTFIALIWGCETEEVQMGEVTLLRSPCWSLAEFRKITSCITILLKR